MDAARQIRPDPAGGQFVWHGLPVDVAVAAGARPKKKALDWLMQFSAERRRCLIYQIDGEWFAFGPPAFQAEIAERIRRGDTPWIG